MICGVESGIRVQGCHCIIIGAAAAGARRNGDQTGQQECQAIGVSAKCFANVNDVNSPIRRAAISVARTCGSIGIESVKIETQYSDDQRAEVSDHSVNA